MTSAAFKSGSFTTQALAFLGVSALKEALDIYARDRARDDAIAELVALEDHELADIGVARRDIPRRVIGG